MSPEPSGSPAHRPVAAPTYRGRLKLEGFVLAACATIAGVAVAALTTPRLDVVFAVQLVVGVGLLAVFGPRSARKAMARSEALGDRDPGSGEPTPLWHLVAIVAVMVPAITLLVDGLGGLSFAVGAALVGLTQALLIERTVAHEERRTRQHYFRRPGSRIGRGTRLGRIPSGVERPASVHPDPGTALRSTPV